MADNRPRKMRSNRVSRGNRRITGDIMKKQLLVAAAAALILSALPAKADWVWPWSVRDPKLATSNFLVGAAATGGYFALRHHHRGNARWHGTVHSAAGAYVATSIGCAAVSPMIGTLVLNRPLTQREVGVSTANCFLPFIGGMLVNAAWEAHPEWSGPPPRRRR
jgi:hypothetical protein